MKKFRELAFYPLQIENPERYLAHSGASKAESETFRQHAERTSNRFFSLCEGGLEGVFDRQIADAFTGNHEEVKALILNLISYHDLGKLNPAFQAKLNNYVVPGWKEDDSTHSKYGWLIFSLAYRIYVDKISHIDDWLNAWILTTVIAGHHTYAWGLPTENSGNLPTAEDVAHAVKIAGAAGLNLNQNKNSLRTLWGEPGRWKNHAPPQALFALYKTIYSALILCDAIATGDARSTEQYSFSNATDLDVRRWRSALSSYQKTKGYRTNADEVRNLPPNEITNLDVLRCKIYAEAEDNLKKGLDEGKRLFYLDAPTGSGKTNCAINLALTILEKIPSIRRAFFVFPFINIIEQNSEVLKKSIAAEDGDIVEVHSMAEWGDAKSEEQCGREYDQRLFLDAKIIVTSSVNFLEALGSSRKNANYKVCSISNSVIVLDEIQGIDDGLWTYAHFLLDSFAKENNCRFILMSATLPRIDEIDYTDGSGFAELLPDPMRYQNHPCFSNRSKIILRNDITTNEETISLARSLISEREKPVKFLIVTNTIERSKEIFHTLPKEFETKSGIRAFKRMLLNSELLPHKKMEVVETAKSFTGDLIVVSTQCIEAGVDADFDMGIRDYAILDSIEQVAGRVNRNGLKAGSELYIVNLEKSGRPDASKVYGKSRRWTAQEGLRQHLESMLSSRDYKPYYDAIIGRINEKNSSPPGQDVSGRRQTDDARKLMLWGLKDFRLINDYGAQSCFIPVNLPADAFSETEIVYLRKFRPDALKNGSVAADAVWAEYSAIKTMCGREGILRMSRFSSILSKYTANRRLRSAVAASEEPIMRLPENWQETYDLDSGFKDSDNVF